MTTAPPISLRPYQSLAIDALLESWRAGEGNAVVELATGAGKSVIMGEFARQLVDPIRASEF